MCKFSYKFIIIFTWKIYHFDILATTKAERNFSYDQNKKQIIG